LCIVIIHLLEDGAHTGQSSSVHVGLRWNRIRHEYADPQNAYGQGQRQDLARRGTKLRSWTQFKGDTKYYEVLW